MSARKTSPESCNGTGRTQEHNNMKTKRILIIDDDLQIGNLEQEVLEQHGYI